MMSGFSGRVLDQPGDGVPAAGLTTVAPAYGTGSLADLLPAAGAVLGVREMADVLGLRERLAGVTKIGVLLVDGLGSYQLPLAAPLSPMVADLAAGGGTLTAGFPSTTPVSLVTLGAGAVPGAHGILGFTVRKPDGGLLNHLHWDDQGPDPAVWQPVPTCFEVARAAGIDVTVVSRPEFEGSGLTVSANRGAEYVGAPDWSSLADRMITALTEGDGPTLVHGYHPDVDKRGHEHGVGSPAWQDAVRDLDRLLERLVHRLPPGSALLVTADHGQLNVPAGDRLDLADLPSSAAGLVAVAGEPRVRYLHTVPGAAAEVIAAYREALGDKALVVGRDEAVAHGWFGPVAPDHLSRIGDVVVVCQGRTVLLSRDREPARAANLVAYHGALTAAEMSVPLLVAQS
jgi:hypothetical protein